MDKNESLYALIPIKCHCPQQHRKSVGPWKQMMERLQAHYRSHVEPVIIQQTHRPNDMEYFVLPSDVREVRDHPLDLAVKLPSCKIDLIGRTMCRPIRPWYLPAVMGVVSSGRSPFLAKIAQMPPPPLIYATDEELVATVQKAVDYLRSPKTMRLVDTRRVLSDE